MITVKKSDFQMLVIPDSDPDVSYLDQEGFENRLDQYNRGIFGFVGIRAEVEIMIPHGDRTSIIQRIQSPGLWGIEDDSGSDCFNDIFADESAILIDMLSELGVKVDD